MACTLNDNCPTKRLCDRSPYNEDENPSDIACPQYHTTPKQVGGPYNRLKRQAHDHAPATAGATRLRPHPTHKSPNGNATWQRNTWERNTAVQRTGMRHSSTMYGSMTQHTAPNEDATTSNDAPGITHPPWQDFTSRANEYQCNPPPPDPAYQHPNDGVLGGPAQTTIHEPEYGPSTPHPLQRVWDPGQNPPKPLTINPRNNTLRTKPTNDSTGPQYPTPAAAGVGYCKILNQNPRKPPTTNPLNNTLQTKTVNKAPRMKTHTLKGVPNGTGPNRGI
ncbi:hypothetical protein BS47DRAFT_1360550 [Hydnum rufescens UP504]|uniref:Uncharacterized protein n=1 Tax=Hydnum rufescens UP504 TaxID=1448309 RepID=A0A9P6DV91_9AGAM|nr:hypothetical protein BS47DRAFT_1360550 [Hydnum rufescens UP504]